ncbi:MAG TPA: hypothetical protein VFO94_20770 [Gammaproteobacteria bacterium]|nr:hypothetical protein [Gammaproteobacteria bacterium]
MHTRIAPFLAIPLAAASWAAPHSALAQQREAHEERGALLLGAFVTEPDTSARLDSDTGLGTDIDLEQDLGLQTSRTVARLGGYYWFGLHHRADFSLFEFARDASKQIDKTIEYGDSVYTISTVVSTSSRVRVFEAAYTFAPVVRERGDFGITAGFYTAKVDLGLRNAASGTDESEGLTAPLPVIGVRGEYEITRRLALRGAVQLFSIDAGDTSGRLADTYLGVDYTFNDRIGVGVAYNKVAMNVDAQDDGGFRGALDWGYDGYMVYLKANFGL